MEATMDLRSLISFWRSPADAGVLGQMTASRLAALLTSAAADRAWSKASQQLARLQLPDNAWGVNPGDRRALYALMLGLQPQWVLEIGTHIGCSTLSMALALQRSGGHLWTVDLQDVNDPLNRPWEIHGSSASPAALARKLDCREHITFVAADSLHYLRRAGPRFDVIFLDGLHTVMQVYHEVILALGRLRPGGFILLHDYFSDRLPLWPDRTLIDGPYLAVEHLRREGVGLAALPLGELPWPTKQGTHSTSLALLVKEPAA